MGITSRKRKSSLVCPFLLGIIIGLLISYFIRYLHKTNLCGNTQSSSSESLRSTPQVSILNPDQVVNLLAVSNDGIKVGTKSNRENEQDSKSRQPHLACPFGSVSGCDKSGNGGNKRRKLLFVGVMTASVFLETRAKAVWETWAKEIPGKVVFFTGGNSYMRRNASSSISIPLVILPGVDDSYPPQKKSFMMLKYMSENYGDDYEFFMRADDDVYVRGKKLADFLRQIDSRRLHFIGQAGRGNRMERGTLNLRHNENFCMGGPGIIFSRPTLKKLAPNVQECLKDLYSTHEDVEVGRCVRRYAGVSCTWAYEMQTVFHHSFKGDTAFTGSLKRQEIHKALTLHPVKDFRQIYRLHAYFQGLQIQDLLYEKIQVHRNILFLSHHVPGPNNNYTFNADVQSQYQRLNLKQVDPVMGPHNSHIMEDLTLTGLPPNLNKYSPKYLDDVIPWDFVRKGIYSSGSISPKLKLKSDSKEALEDVVKEIMESLNSHSRARGRIVDFKDILYGYRRVNPLHGVDYILDLLMTYRKYRGKKITIPVRRHVYVQRPFSPLQMRLMSSTEMPKDLPQTIKNVKPKIVMIVPLAERYTTFKRFLDNFSSTCMDLFKVSNTSKNTNDESRTCHNTSKIVSNPLFELSLIIVLFGSNEDKQKFLHLVQTKRDLLSVVYGVSLCKIKVVQIDTEFSRAIALETGISQCNDEDLLFLIDVDLIFNANVVRRVHLNTRLGQAYFPIVYSEYNPKFYNLPENEIGNKSSLSCSNFSANKNLSPCKRQLNSDTGYWRKFGFGIGSFYKSDFRQAGGFDTTIKGWGKEDVLLFDRFLSVTNITIFRAPDPELIHIFHEMECDAKLNKEQFDMCEGSKVNTLGSEINLMKYILNQKKTGLNMANLSVGLS